MIATLIDSYEEHTKPLLIIDIQDSEILIPGYQSLEM